MPSVPMPDDVQCPLIGKLKKNWSWDATRKVFMGPRGAEFDPADKLPPDSTIAYRVPILANQPKTKLSAAERDLQSYIQITFPKGVDAESEAIRVAQWPCLASAVAAPKCELPSM